MLSLKRGVCVCPGTVKWEQLHLLKAFYSISDKGPQFPGFKISHPQKFLLKNFENWQNAYQLLMLPSKNIFLKLCNIVIAFSWKKGQFIHSLIHSHARAHTHTFIHRHTHSQRKRQPWAQREEPWVSVTMWTNSLCLSCSGAVQTLWQICITSRSVGY